MSRSWRWRRREGSCWCRGRGCRCWGWSECSGRCRGRSMSRSGRWRRREGSCWCRGRSCRCWGRSERSRCCWGRSMGRSWCWRRGWRWCRYHAIIADDIHHPEIYNRQVVLHSRTAERVERVVGATGPVLQIAAEHGGVVECLEKVGPVIDRERSARAVVQTPYAGTGKVEQIKLHIVWLSEGHLPHQTDAGHDFREFVHGYADEIECPGHGAVGRIIGVGESATKGVGSIVRKIIGSEAQRFDLCPSQDIQVATANRIRHGHRPANAECRRVVRSSRIRHHRVSQGGIVRNREDESVAHPERASAGHRSHKDVDVDGVGIISGELQSRIVARCFHVDDVRWGQTGVHEHGVRVEGQVNGQSGGCSGQGKDR